MPAEEHDYAWTRRSAPRPERAVAAGRADARRRRRVGMRADGEIRRQRQQRFSVTAYIWARAIIVLLVKVQRQTSGLEIAGQNHTE